MPLTRTPHWATRELHDFLLARAKEPFRWGTNDCCLFPADAIRAFTSIDLAAPFRGQYTDEASALALIHSIAGGTTVGDVAAWCAQQHGLTEYQHPKMAQRGDLVVMQNGAALIAGVVHLNGRHLITVAAEGLVRLPITKVCRSWAV